VFGDKVGIFTTAPNAAYEMHISKTSSVAASSMYTLAVNGTFNGTLAANYNAMGMTVVATNNAVPNGNTLTVYGNYIVAANPVGYLCTNLYASVCVASLTHTTGTVGVSLGVQGQILMNGDGGTLTTAYGGFFGVTQTAGTITTGYGVYISTVGGTTTWGLYQAAAANSNYFAGCILIGSTSILDPGATNTIAVANGTAPDSSIADSTQIYSADQAAGNACLHTRTEGGAIIKLFQGAALTAQLTTITHTAPGTPDYAIQDLVQTTGYGFVTKDEGNSVLKVIANLQTRVSELETRLKAHGLLA